MGVYKSSKDVRVMMSKKYEYDEEALTTTFMNGIGNHKHMRLYRYTQNDESITGADLLWIVVHDAGVYLYVVQAKKLDGKRITKKKAYYNKGAQLQSLLSTARSIRAFPIYMLYSSKINKVACDSANGENTSEGVFFEPAEIVKTKFANGTQNEMHHKPVSCLFSCYKEFCHYTSSLKDCDGCSVCMLNCSADPQKCCTPFESFFFNNYGLQIEHHQFDQRLIPFIIAESVYIDHPGYVQQSMNSMFGLNSTKHSIKNIILTEYLGRHDDSLTQVIMGHDFEVDHTTVLDLELIKKTIVAEKYKVKGIISKIGVFGSYARGTQADLYRGIHAPTGESDVDIAIKYSQSALSCPEHIDRLMDFIRSIINTLKKNIDFIDYKSSTLGNDEFKKTIDRFIIWL